MLDCFFIMSKYTNFKNLFHDISYKAQDIILIMKIVLLFYMQNAPKLQIYTIKEQTESLAVLRNKK